MRFLGRKSWKLWLFGKRIIRKCFKKVLNSFIQHFYLENNKIKKNLIIHIIRIKKCQKEDFDD